MMTHQSPREAVYHDGDVPMIGRFFASSANAPAPGVLVLHGAHGLSSQIEACAARIAARGYSVLAADLWGSGRLINDPAEIGATLGRFAGDRAMWARRVEAARIALLAEPSVDASRIAAVGYCFGGTSVLEFVRMGGELKGGISLHGGLDLIADDWGGARPGSKVLVCSGDEDPMAAPSDRARVLGAMSKGGVTWELDLYSHTRHAFTEPDRPGAPPFAAYNAVADRRSWIALGTFLQEVFTD